MTNDEAAHILLMALTDTLDSDPAAQAAMQFLVDAGLRFIRVDFVLAGSSDPVHQVLASDSDADFLRSLRIAPDLTPSERDK
jgi:hypothetical protein